MVCPTRICAPAHALCNSGSSVGGSWYSAGWLLSTSSLMGWNQDAYLSDTQSDSVDKEALMCRMWWKQDNNYNRKSPHPENGRHRKNEEEKLWESYAWNELTGLNWMKLLFSLHWLGVKENDFRTSSTPRRNSSNGPSFPIRTKHLNQHAVWLTMIRKM